MNKEYNIIPQIGDTVETPRFLKVRIEAVLYEEDAMQLGFTEPTHLDNKAYRVLGRCIGQNRMDFSVVLDRQK